MYSALNRCVAGRRSSARALLSVLARSKQPDNPQAIRNSNLKRYQSSESATATRKRELLTSFMSQTFNDSYLSTSASPSLRSSLTSDSFTESQASTKSFPSPRQIEQQFSELDTFVRKFGRVNRQDVEQVFESLHRLKEVQIPIPATQFLMLLRGCGFLMCGEPPKERAELLNQIWSSLSPHTKLDISHFNALLKAYIDNETYVDPVKILKEIESRKLAPNRVTYQRLIHIYCQRGDMKGAAEILELMKTKDVPINQFVFNSLILGYGKAGDLQSAHSTLKTMRDSGVEPSNETYAALICAHAEKIKESEEHVDRIRSLLEEAAKEDIVLSKSNYFSIIKSLARSAEDTPLIDELIDAIPKNLDFVRASFNATLDLVCDDRIDTAVKVFKSMPHSQSLIEKNVVGAFLIKQMVKMRAPPAKVIEVCQELHEERLNVHGMRCAAYWALYYKDTPAALIYLNQLSKIETIRPHYFWPLIVESDYGEMMRIICEELRKSEGPYSSMHETFSEWIWPRVRGDPFLFIEKCSSSGYPYTLLISSYIDHEIIQGNADKVLDILRGSQYQGVKIQTMNILNRLSDMILNPDDTAAILEILTQRADSIQATDEQIDYPGQFLLMILGRRNSEGKEYFEKILNSYARRSLKITSEAAERLLARSKMSEEIEHQIKALISDEKRPVVKQRRMPAHEEQEERPRRALTIDDFERMLSKQDPDSAEADRTRASLLIRYCKTPRLASYETMKDQVAKRVEELMNDLKKHDSLSPSLLGFLVHYYSLTGETEKALNIKSQIPADFILNAHRIFDLAACLVRNGKLHDAMALLEDEIKKRNKGSVGEESDDEEERLVVADSSDLPSSRSANRLLSAVAETTKDPQVVKNALKHVLDLVEGRANPLILSSLIKVHLMNGSLDGAVDEFCRCCESYRCAPHRANLIKALLQSKDTQLLRRVLDANTELYGQHNSLLTLAVACVEEGKLKQAKKVLETQGLRLNTANLGKICENYVRTNRAEELEDLIEVTREVLDPKDRDEMYHQLLQIYSKNNDAEKALNVWTAMQDEDTITMNMSVRNKRLLAEILERNGINAPFDTLEANVSNDDRSKDQGRGRQGTVRKLMAQDEFSNALKNQDIELALRIKEQKDREGKGLTLSQYSQLIETLLKNHMLKEALTITQRLLAEKLFPHPNTIRYLLQRLSIAGDVDGMKSLQVPESITKTTLYTSLLASAYVNSQRVEELMNDILPNLNPFPVGGINAILNARPDLEPRIEALARKKAEEGKIQPINMVWLYCMKTGKYDRAKEIFQTTPKLKDNLLFSDLIDQIRETKDVTLARELVDQVKVSNLTPRTIGLTYSLLLDALVNKNEYELAEKIVFEEVMNDSLTRTNRETGLEEPRLTISEINRRVLIEIRDAFVRNAPEKDVRFQVPPPRKSQNTTNEQTD